MIGNMSQVRLMRIYINKFIPLFMIADTPWSTSNTTPTVLDWSFIRPKRFIRHPEEVSPYMVLVAQMAVSGSTGHLELYDYSTSQQLVQLDTTATIKSNYEQKEFIMPISSLLSDDGIVLRAWIDDATQYVYIGKVVLVYREVL